MKNAGIRFLRERSHFAGGDNVIDDIPVDVREESILRHRKICVVTDDLLEIIKRRLFARQDDLGHREEQIEPTAERQASICLDRGCKFICSVVDSGLENFRVAWPLTF